MSSASEGRSDQPVGDGDRVVSGFLVDPAVPAASAYLLGRADKRCRASNLGREKKDIQQRRPNMGQAEPGKPPPRTRTGTPVHIERSRPCSTLSMGTDEGEKGMIIAGNAALFTG